MLESNRTSNVGAPSRKHVTLTAHRIQHHKIITASTVHRQVTVLPLVLCKCYDAGVCGVPKGYARRFLLLAVTFFSFLSESWKRMVDV